MSCWRCGAPTSEPGYCSTCRLAINRERVWQEAGFNPTGDTPFDPDFNSVRPGAADPGLLQSPTELALASHEGRWRDFG